MSWARFKCYKKLWKGWEVSRSLKIQQSLAKHESQRTSQEAIPLLSAAAFDSYFSSKESHFPFSHMFFLPSLLLCLWKTMLLMSETVFLADNYFQEIVNHNCITQHLFWPTWEFFLYFEKSSSVFPLWLNLSQSKSFHLCFCILVVKFKLHPRVLQQLTQNTVLPNTYLFSFNYLFSQHRCDVVKQR